MADTTTAYSVPSDAAAMAGAGDEIAGSLARTSVWRTAAGIPLLRARAEREIQIFEDAGIKVLNGRYGPYVTDGKKSVVGEAYVEAVEDVETSMGVIRSFKVNLDIKHLSGVFKKSDDAELVVWFSADHRRIPVKVRSKVAVGHFTLELVDYQPPSVDSVVATHP